MKSDMARFLSDLRHWFHRNWAKAERIGNSRSNAPSVKQVFSFVIFVFLMRAPCSATKKAVHWVVRECKIKKSENGPLMRKRYLTMQKTSCRLHCEMSPESFGQTSLQSVHRYTKKCHAGKTTIVHFTLNKGADGTGANGVSSRWPAEESRLKQTAKVPVAFHKNSPENEQRETTAGFSGSAIGVKTNISPGQISYSRARSHAEPLGTPHMIAETRSWKQRWVVVWLVTWKVSSKTVKVRFIKLATHCFFFLHLDTRQRHLGPVLPKLPNLPRSCR